jgi:phage terminase large subunit-like protein
MTYSERAKAYAERVVAGEQLAGKWTILACRRHLDDLERWPKRDSRYYFHAAAADIVCEVIEGLRHVKGEWARRRETIKLEDWQCFFVCVLFGWRREDGKRRFRTGYLEVARKNAKTTLLAGILLYLLRFDNEAGAEVYSAATTRDQAKIVWQTARAMVLKDPKWASLGVKAHAHSISHEGEDAFFKALSAEAHTLDGLNPHGIGVDELHAHPTREVWDVLETATGSREQPLQVAITTAGSDRSGICYEVRTHLTKVLERVFVDETFFGIIYALDVDDDWTDERLWIKPNPNLGVSVKLDDLQRKADKARSMVSAQPNWLTKHGCLWVSSDHAWMDMRRWEACAEVELDEAKFEGLPCWLGVDLASKVDLTAVVKLFEVDGKVYVFKRYYCPEEAVESSRNSQYPGWQRSGKIIATDGAVVDFGRIKEDLLEDRDRFDVRAIGYDPWQAAQLAQELEAEGLPMVEVRNTTQNLSEPMKELEALAMSGRLVHDGCPCTAWQVSNVVCHRDNKDNVFPKKEREENKIDGPVAMMFALGLQMRMAAPGFIDESQLVFG